MADSYNLFHRLEEFVQIFDTNNDGTCTVSEVYTGLVRNLPFLYGIS